MNAKSIGSDLRAKRIGPLLEMIDAAFKQNGCVNIIDIGGTERYWGILPADYLTSRNVSITVVNLFPPTTPNYGPFSFVQGDACNLDGFADKSFDIAHSNSVIEHVGDWTCMIKFSKEVKRVAKSYFVQTPNYWFPIEPHCMTLFFHWLPEPAKVWMVERFKLGHWKRGTSTLEAVGITQNARLMNRKMFSALFGDAHILTERVLLLPKSFIAVRGEGK